MTVAVVVPTFALADCEWRARAFTLVHENLLALDGLDHYWSGWRGTGASPAAARNNGAGLSAADILVFNDADTLVPHAQIREAARLATEAPGLVFAFTDYDRLDQAATETIRHPADAFTAPVDETFTEPPSHGCVAISRGCFREVGGYDERLEAFEDCDLTGRCERRWPSRRVAGRAVHLWHPRLGDAGDDAWEQRFAASRRIYEHGPRRG